MIILNAVHLLPDGLVDEITLNNPKKLDTNAITVIINIFDDGTVSPSKQKEHQISSGTLFEIVPTVLRGTRYIHSYEDIGENMSKIKEFTDTNLQINELLNKCRGFKLSNKIKEYEDTLILLKDLIKHKLDSLKIRLDNKLNCVFISVLISKIYFACSLREKEIDNITSFDKKYDDNYVNIMKITIEALGFIK